jgi:hypothetical protein
MGGGNGLKSHMAREKNNAKKLADSKSRGGGSEGLKERTESKLAVSCAICRAPFTSSKMKAQLIGHWETKHSKNTFAECFPDTSQV